MGNDIAITIAGNKIDLEKNRHVVEKDALDYADGVGAAHYHTSAKLNKGLDDAFVDLAHKMMVSTSSKKVLCLYRVNELQSKEIQFCVY